MRAGAIFCEDSEDEVRVRENNIRLGLHVHPDASPVHWVARLGEDNIMMTFSREGIGQTTPFFNQINEMVGDLGLDVLLLDGAADVFPGNQNDLNQVTQFMRRCCGQLALQHNCGVVSLAHPSDEGLSSSKKFSGSRAWSNTARSRLYMGRDADDKDGRVLEVCKANWAPSGSEYQLKYRAGIFVTVDDSDEALKEDRVREMFIDLLQKSQSLGVAVSANPKGNYAPSIFAKEPTAKKARYSRSDFAAAMDALLEDETIVSREFRTDRFRLEFGVTHHSKSADPHQAVSP